MYTLFLSLHADMTPARMSCQTTDRTGKTLNILKADVPWGCEPADALNMLLDEIRVHAAAQADMIRTEMEAARQWRERSWSEKWRPMPSSVAGSPPDNGFGEKASAQEG